jgi:hypothetical protein
MTPNPSPSPRPVVTVNDRTPRCASRNCGVALRLSRSLAAGLCCCCRLACTDDDYYVDLLAVTAVTA